MLSLRTQMAFALFVGLATGLMLDQRSLTSPPPAPTAPATPTPALETPQPFVTHSNMLMVEILARREGPPEILRTMPLERGRITLVTAGDSTLELQDAAGVSLYRLSFQPGFVGGEPPRLRDEVTLIFVVPFDPAAKRVVLTMAGGTATAEITP